MLNIKTAITILVLSQIHALKNVEEVKELKATYSDIIENKLPFLNAKKINVSK